MPASGALPTTLVLGKPENGKYMSHVGTHGYSDNLYIQHTFLLAYFKQLSSFSLPSVVLAVDVSMQCSLRRCLRAVSKSADIMGELKRGSNQLYAQIQQRSKETMKQQKLACKSCTRSSPSDARSPRGRGRRSRRRASGRSSKSPRRSPTAG